MEVGVSCHLVDKTINISGVLHNVVGLIDLKVSPGMRQRGLGRAMLLAAEDYARGASRDVIVGFTGDREGAIGFYKKCGWAVTDKLYEGKHMIYKVVKADVLKGRSVSVEGIW